MESETSVIEREPITGDDELARREREVQETRQALAEKVGLLEKNVTTVLGSTTDVMSETVHGVTDAVSEALSSAKETIEGATTSITEGVTDVVEGVKSVGQTLDISAHVKNNPLTAVGTSVAAGFLFSQLFGSSSSSYYRDQLEDERRRRERAERGEAEAEATAQQYEWEAGYRNFATGFDSISNSVTNFTGLLMSHVARSLFAK